MDFNIIKFVQKKTILGYFLWFVSTYILGVFIKWYNIDFSNSYENIITFLSSVFSLNIIAFSLFSITELAKNLRNITEERRGILTTKLHIFISYFYFFTCITIITTIYTVILSVVDFETNRYLCFSLPLFVCTIRAVFENLERYLDILARNGDEF